MRLSIIDYFKLFFAVCIVAIHTNLLDILSEQQNWYCMHMVLRLAVPYFFVASGYFWGLKVNRNNVDPAYAKECRNSYVKRNLPPFLFWSSWGLLFFSIANITKNGLSAIPLIIKTALFYPLGAMWFVSSCIVAVIIITALRNKRRLLLILGGGGYFFALICNTYYFVICDNHVIKLIVDSYMDIFLTARNGIFVGLLFVGMGFCLSREDNFIKRMKTSTLSVFFVFSYAFLAVEIAYTYQKQTIDDNSLLLSLPLVSVFLFELTSRIIMKPGRTGSLLESRHMSARIYFMHRFFISPTMHFAVIFFITPPIYFIVILSLCLATYYLTRNSNNRFVRMVLP